MQVVLLYAGSAVIFLWGIGHVMPTRQVVAGFGTLSADNARVVTMEWLAEGFTLAFLGLMVALSVALLGPGTPGTTFVARAAAGLLASLAVLSAFTGARTSVLPMRLCPYVKSAVAAAFVAATLV